MNLALLEESDFVADNQVRLTGRRFHHLQQTLKKSEGESLCVGLVDGDVGVARITSLQSDHAELEVKLDQKPPSALPLTLVLALPRPKMLRRVLQGCASLGVKQIWLINAYRVEKSYWQTPWLSEQAIRENLILGLEQAMDTRMPVVHQRKRFKPFVEDELPALLAQRPGLVAHPRSERPCPAQSGEPATLCVGPEGGFIPYEVDLLMQQGCRGVHIGSRILRTEIAVPALIGRLFDLADV